VTQLRTNILLVALGILAATSQLVVTRWGVIGDLAGGCLCGVILLAGIRVLALRAERLYLPSLAAAAASLLGLALAKAGSGLAYPSAVWAAPLFAALLSGVPALSIVMRGARCQLCHARLRHLLSFSCPRCRLVACEDCWRFERGRCSLCEANQVPLFPLDFSWWQEHFGSQVHVGRCALCLRVADWSVAHWACGGCGHSQCRSCWDENNGECSRCGWTVPDLPVAVSEYVAVGTRHGTLKR
jgi:hypothetical protein